MGRYRLPVIAQRSIEQIGLRSCFRVLGVYDELGQHEHFYIWVGLVGILNSEVEAVVFVPPFCHCAVRNIFQQLVDVGKIDILAHLPATESNADNFQWFFQRHARRHDCTPMGGWLVCVIHKLFPLWSV